MNAIKGHPDVSRMLRNQGKSVWMATKTTKGGNPVRVGFLSGTAHPEFTDRDSLALALKDLGVTDMGEKSNENAKAKLIRGPVSASYANVKVEGDAIVVLADDSVKDAVTDQLTDVTSSAITEASRQLDATFAMAGFRKALLNGEIDLTTYTDDEILMTLLETMQHKCLFWKRARFLLNMFQIPGLCTCAPS